MAARGVPEILTPSLPHCGREKATPRAAGPAGPMFVPELAQRLGYTPDHLRRHIDRLVIEARMPCPMLCIGWKRWDRPAIEAWLKGYVAANDVRPAHVADVEAEREMLRQAYAAR